MHVISVALTCYSYFFPVVRINRHPAAFVISFHSSLQVVGVFFPLFFFLCLEVSVQAIVPAFVADTCT